MMQGRRSFPPTLQLLRGPEPGRSFSLDRFETTVGKDASCDIVLPDKTVSKRHARIRRQDDGLYLCDLNSLNGTHLNGKRLSGPAKLHNGDSIRICDYLFSFSLPTLDFHEESGESSIVDSIDLSSTTVKPDSVRPEEKLEAIQEISRDLLGTIDLKEVLEKILGHMLRMFPQADCAFVLLQDETTGEPVPRAMKFREGKSEPLSVSRTIFRRIVAENRAILSTDARADFGSSSVTDARIGTVMAVPLVDQRRRPVGIVQIDTRSRPGRFALEDLELLGTIAIHISVAVENARLHAMEVEHAELEKECKFATEIQHALLPHCPPRLPGFEFWNHYSPARFVGGDYFDYNRPAHPSGGWSIALGDVSGKGMAAALLMARLSSQVRLLLQSEPEPARVVERLNQELCEAEIGDKFITFLLAVIDSNGRELTLVNAGHMAPFIRRADGTVDEVGEDHGGPPLAIVPGQTYTSACVPLEPGDVVVLYTDGVTEAMAPDGCLFTAERLKHTLGRTPGGAAAVGEAIIDAVRRHAAGRSQSDDITLVCFSRVEPHTH
jgi:sigma-B regulation protein RsbU (phosphoserine phosphatase)